LLFAAAIIPHPRAILPALSSRSSLVYTIELAWPPASACLFLCGRGLGLAFLITVLLGQGEVTMEQGSRILIIDDDPIYVKSTRAVLEAHGYQVDSAPNGEIGLSKMQEERPDLVILDVMMGWVLEGVTVSQEMMDQRDLRRVPIIMVTSIRNSEYKGLFPQDQYLHINSWLDKPCAPDKLVSEVRKTLARHQKYQKSAA
jgi:CheY-like chemotaxis protein